MDISALFSNYALNCAVLSWCSAQIIKMLFVLIKTKKFVPDRLFGTGGMPSSHSASVTALAVAVCRLCGFASVEFAIAFMFANIVVYDAHGIRREAGKHAKAINCIEEQLTKNDGTSKEPKSNRLKEALGHNLIEVAVGALLGVIIAFILPM